METKTKTQAPHRDHKEAQEDIWKYVFGFTPIAVLKCAIELRISETVESQGGSVTLPELSAALLCSPSALHRIMRYLIHHGFFKQTYDDTIHDQESSVRYAQTPLSRLLSRDGMAALILLESSPVMLAPWHGLSRRALAKGTSAFGAANGGADVWEYAASNPDHSKLINDAMACHARVAVSVIVDEYAEAFEGIGSLVDVGGGDGTALSMLVEACPWVRGVNFDLPHVVSIAPCRQGVEHVGGDMFQMVPRADAAFIMWVLHDWSDEECIQILRNCKSAIPKDSGKVIIVEAVIREDEGNDRYNEVRLALDMVMMAHTEKGKERTCKEWEDLVNAAGFSKCTVKHIQEIVSVIEAYP